MKKKILTQNFKILTPPPNRPNSKFWNSDFARWWHLSRRFISEKIGASSWKLIEWQAKNLQKWPNFTQFWLWTPIKNFRDKNSKFHFQHFLPNIGLKKYAKFQRATIKTLGGDSVSKILTPPPPPPPPPPPTPLSTRSHQLRWLRHSGANNMFVSHKMSC